MKDIRTIRRMIRNAIARPYRVAITWDGRTFYHRAATVADALGWAELYPAGSTVTVTTRFGRAIAARRTARALGWQVA
jgi:hypothetical protein